MLRPGQRVLVGVSGGADSVCLLLILMDLGYEVGVAHLNHGLRGLESDADETFVRDLCEQRSVRFFGKRVKIPTERGNLEADGRQARKEFFAEIVKSEGFDRIALAHNRDDRVETFLLNLWRGAGTAGLTSMEPVTGVVVRPLIRASRQEIESYLGDIGQTWRTDPTNRDTRFARNRLRHDTIPTLKDAFNPKLPEALSRTIELLDDENAWMEMLSLEWLGRHGTRNATGYVISVSALASGNRALQRRVLRETFKELGGLKDVGFDHVESALQLVAGPNQSGKRIQIPGGLTVTRSFGELVVQSRTDPPAEFDYELRIPGEVHIPELGRIFMAKVVTEAGNYFGTERVIVDGGNLGPYVRIRNWRPGDYYRPVGLPAGKLKKLFQKARIPRSQRHQWPVLVADSTIVWVASFPVSREFAPRGGSKRIVAFEASPI